METVLEAHAILKDLGNVDVAARKSNKTDVDLDLRNLSGIVDYVFVTSPFYRS